MYQTFANLSFAILMSVTCFALIRPRFDALLATEALFEPLLSFFLKFFSVCPSFLLFALSNEQVPWESPLRFLPFFFLPPICLARIRTPFDFVRLVPFFFNLRRVFRLTRIF